MPVIRVVSWNVQWCRGLDGNVDPARIAAHIARYGADVACLQEVAAGFTELPGSSGEDQPAALAQALPGYAAAAAWGVDRAGDGGVRMRFGNMVLSRLPVVRIRRHSLPWPAAPDSPSMPRVAVDAWIETPLGTLRVITTHLEYYSAAHRAAQVRRLAEILEEGTAPRKASDDPGPFRTPPAPAGAILCGDFNLPPQDPLHDDILRIGLVDAWQALHPGEAHPPSFRLHDRREGQAPYFCDFIFVTPGLAPHLAAIRIDADNRASDHQPVIVELR